MAKFRFDYAVSLGTSCRTRHQLRRVVGKHRCRSGVFDNQVTPAATVAEYFRRDLRGMFDRADLALVDGSVVNVRYGTMHPHEFDGEIDTASYEVARAKHDYLCQKMRSLADVDAAILFVITPELPADVEREIRRLCKRPTFRILEVDDATPSTVEWSGDNRAWDAALGAAVELRPTLRQALRIQGLRLRREARRLVGMENLA